MASNPLSPPPFLAWLSMPKEFVKWFNDAWTTVVGNITAIEGNSTNITSLNSGLNLANTNLTTLQTQVTTLQTRATTDEAAITALQSRATTDETAIAGKLTASNNLSDVPSAATARTNLGLGSGVSGTITIPKIASTTGSITVVNGIITAFTNPT